MPASSGGYPDFAMLLLRSVPMVMLCCFHGWGKLTAAWAHVFHGAEWGMVGFVGSMGFPVPIFFAICSALAESIAALLVAVGFFTRYAAAIVALNLLVALYHHFRTDLKIELVALYVIPALVFVFTAPGKFSVDGAFARRR